MTSLKDVAERAGVSQNTVSCVLNNKVEARIAPATQERVRRLAAELGYQPNRAARSLSRGRTETVGLLISGLGNPFFVHVVEAVEQLAAQAGYHVMMDATPGGGGHYARHGNLRGWPVDGVLMWVNHPQPLSDFLGERAVTTPVVYLGGEFRTPEGRLEPAAGDWIKFDLYQGARQAAEYVIARGRRRIAHIVPPDYTDTWHGDGRHEAYRDVCLEAGLPLETIVSDRPDRQAGWVIGAALAGRTVAERPDAVFCHNDVIAMSLLQRLRRAGVRVPEEVAVIGFDGTEEGQLLETPLTTVTIPIIAVLGRAIEVLTARIAGDRRTPLQQIVPTIFLAGETA